MSNYSNNPGFVQVALFKASGVYFAAGSVDMSNYNIGDLAEQLLAACKASHAAAADHADGEGWPLLASPGEWLAMGGVIVCLEPYHVAPNPVMLKGK